MDVLPFLAAHFHKLGPNMPPFVDSIFQEVSLILVFPFIVFNIYTLIFKKPLFNLGEFFWSISSRNGFKNSFLHPLLSLFPLGSGFFMHILAFFLIFVCIFGSFWKEGLAHPPSVENPEVFLNLISIFWYFFYVCCFILWKKENQSLLVPNFQKVTNLSLPRLIQIFLFLKICIFILLLGETTHVNFFPFFFLSFCP